MVSNRPFGVPVPFKGRLTLNQDIRGTGNLYSMLLNSVNTDSKRGVRMIPSEHIFTEKELVRAVSRFDNEHDDMGLYNIDHVISDETAGYVGVNTYTNRNKVLATRFVIKFDGYQVGGLADRIHVGSFTPREFARSMSRIKWHNNWFYRLFKSIVGHFR